MGSLRKTQFSSSVMDFIFCRSDSSHVSVDTVHPSLLRSSCFSSPRLYPLESLSSDVFLISSLHEPKPPQFREETRPRIRRRNLLCWFQNRSSDALVLAIVNHLGTSFAMEIKILQILELPEFYCGYKNVANFVTIFVCKIESTVKLKNATEFKPPRM